MGTCKVKIQLKNGAKVPVYGSLQAAGADICACISNPIVVPSHKWILVPTGLSIELDKGYEAQIRPRSGLAAKNGITVLNSPGTIDSDYRGEIKVILINHSDTDYIIKNGDRIAQMVIAKHELAEFELCNELTESIRGNGGFGSTGINN